VQGGRRELLNVLICRTPRVADYNGAVSQCQLKQLHQALGSLQINVGEFSKRDRHAACEFGEINSERLCFSARA